jgi:hypothetical protein
VAALAVFVFFRNPAFEKATSATTVVAGQQMRSAQVRQPEVVIGPSDPTAPIQRPEKVQRVAKYDSRQAGRDVTTLEYYVDLPSGWRTIARTFAFNARGIDMHVGQHVSRNGLDLWLAEQDGQYFVFYEGLRGAGYAFQAPELSPDDLVDLVAGYLIDDVGAR